MVENANSHTLFPEAPEPIPVTVPKNTSLERIRKTTYAFIAGAFLSVLPNAHGDDMPDAAPAFSVTDTEGTLVIGGGGNMPKEVVDLYIKRAGGREGIIALITTASEVADEPVQDVNMYLKGWEMGGATVQIFHTRNRDNANSEDFIAPIRNATAAWFIGGRQISIKDAYYDTLVERELQNLLKRGGVVGGTSAGAAAMSPRMIEKGNPLAIMNQGLRLLPREITVDQHFWDRNRFPRLQGALEEGQTGFGIDEETALVVKGHECTVIGNKNVRLCQPNKEPVVLKSGDRVDLKNHLKVSVGTGVR
jgi:cyanophycinase